MARMLRVDGVELDGEALVSVLVNGADHLEAPELARYFGLSLRQAEAVIEAYWKVPPLKRDDISVEDVTVWLWAVEIR